jgi:PLP dependent protein
MLADRIAHIERSIQQACARAGRLRSDVTLIAVTKTQPASIINDAIQLGLTELGENRVQEYLSKRGQLLPHRFHMIGHLQRNKVRQIIGMPVLIHSVDSVELAAEIDKRSQASGIVTDVLLEVNTSGEESKEGVSPADLRRLADALRPMRALRLRGLMTVAAFEDAECVRPAFRLLRELRDELRIAFNDEAISELSMGMTNDFQVAIEEGATIIRIGSAIFGPRH